MTKLLIPLVVLIGAALGLFMLDEPQEPADFVFINRGDVTTLDLSRMSWMQDLRVAGALWETLVQNDIFDQAYTPQPAAAERWEVSPDGRTYTFYLRPGAAWTNGQPVKAEHFVYAWRRGMLPELAGDYITLFQAVKNGRAFTQRRLEETARFAQEGRGRARPEEARALWLRSAEWFDRHVGVRARGDFVLEMELEQPIPYLLDALSLELFAPLYPPLLERYTSIDPVTAQVRVDAGWTKPGVLVSNGGYRLSGWRFKRDMRLDKSEHYWNAAALPTGSILMPSINDPNAQVLAFQTGGVDWVSDVIPDYRAEMLDRKRRYHERFADTLRTARQAGTTDPVALDRLLPPHPDLNIHAFPAFGTFYYNFNCNERFADGRPNPFHDRRVRKAFALALNKQNIADNVRRLGEPVARTLVPPGSLGGYAVPEGLPCAPDPGAIAQARSLLAQAGFPDAKGLPEIEILITSDGWYSKAAQASAKDWQTNLGARVIVREKEVKVFRDDLKNANYMISRGGWYGDFGDATTFLDLMLSYDGNNDRKYNDPDYDAMMASARAQTDPEARLRILEAAEKKIVEDDLPLIPVFHYSQVFLFDPHTVSGISPHPRQKSNMLLLARLARGQKGLEMNRGAQTGGGAARGAPGGLPGDRP